MHSQPSKPSYGAWSAITTSCFREMGSPSSFRETGTLAVRMAPLPRRRAPMDSTAGEKSRDVWTAPVSTPIINCVPELHASATGVPSRGLAASMGGELLSWIGRCDTQETHSMVARSMMEERNIKYSVHNKQTIGWQGFLPAYRAF